MGNTPVPTLTGRQAQILSFLCAYQEEHGQPPTLREVMARFGFKSTNAVVCHLKPLVRKGVLTHDPFTSRAFQVPAGIPHFQQGDWGVRLIVPGRCNLLLTDTEARKLYEQLDGMVGGNHR